MERDTQEWMLYIQDGALIAFTCQLKTGKEIVLSLELNTQQSIGVQKQNKNVFVALIYTSISVMYKITLGILSLMINNKSTFT